VCVYKGERRRRIRQIPLESESLPQFLLRREISLCDFGRLTPVSVTADVTTDVLNRHHDYLP
jgi:hypothetical protein